MIFKINSLFIDSSKITTIAPYSLSSNEFFEAGLSIDGQKYSFLIYTDSTENLDPKILTTINDTLGLLSQKIILSDVSKDKEISICEIDGAALLTEAIKALDLTKEKKDD